MSKDISIKVPNGFKEIKATIFSKSEYKGRPLYVLMGSGEVFALDKDERIGYINVILPNKEAYDELLEPLNNQVKKGNNINDSLMSVDEIPSVIWLDVPFEELHNTRKIFYDRKMDKIDSNINHYFYCLFSLNDYNFLNFKKSFSPLGVVCNEDGVNEVVYGDQTHLIEPYIEKIKSTATSSLLNVGITIKDGSIRSCEPFYKITSMLQPDDDERIFVSFVPVFNNEILQELQSSERISVLGDFFLDKMSTSDFKKIFNDAMYEKYTLVTENKTFEPDYSGFSKYRK